MPEPIYDNHETAWFIENSEGERIFQESPYLQEVKWILNELRAKNDKETYKVMRVERYTAIFDQNC